MKIDVATRTLWSASEINSARAGGRVEVDLAYKPVEDFYISSAEGFLEAAELVDQTLDYLMRGRDHYAHALNHK